MPAARPKQIYPQMVAITVMTVVVITMATETAEKWATAVVMKAETVMIVNHHLYIDVMMINAYAT